MALFVLCALPVLVLTALLTPPGQSPDEPTHVARAEGLLHGAVLGARAQEPDPDISGTKLLAGVRVNQSLIAGSFGVTTPVDGRPVVTEQDFQAMLAQPPQPQRVFVNIPNTVTYFPATYVPAALGLAAGALFAGGKPFFCIMLARFGMAAAYLALGLLALRIAAYGEALLLAVLLMPMSLFLAGTVNQDGVLIALATVAGAALTRETAGYRALGLVALTLALMAKPPYLPLLALFLLPLSPPGLLTRLRNVALAALPVLLWAALISAFIVVPFYKPPYYAGPLFAGDHSTLLDHTDAVANLHILLAQPQRLFTLPWHTLGLWGVVWLGEMVGVLGLLQISMPVGYYVLWSVAIGGAVAGLLCSGRPVAYAARQQAAHLLWVVGLIAVNAWLIMLTFYLDWSNVGIDYIDGIQGRYLLPFIPFLAVAVPSLMPRLRLAPLLPAVPVVLLGLFDIGYIPMRLVQTYYMH